MDEWEWIPESGGVGTSRRDDRGKPSAAERVARAVEDLTFDKAEFPAWIKRGSVKFDNSGNCEVTFVVPTEHRLIFAELGKAMRQPLLVTVEKFDGTER